MNQPPKPPGSFFDDPKLDASFADLDRGMSGGEVQVRVPDDPEFDGSVSELDLGMRADDVPREPAPRLRRPVAPPLAGTTAAPPRPTLPAPISESTMVAPTAPVTRFGRTAELLAVAQPRSGESAAPAVRPGATRPLIDLFPPAPGVQARSPVSAVRAERLLDFRPPAPGSGLAPPPRIIRNQGFPGAPVTTDVSAAVTYEPFYGLTEKPFSLSTDPRFIYHTASHDRAIEALLDGLERGDGIMVLTGDDGLGKTTLCRSLVQQRGRRSVTSLLTEPIASFEQLLKGVLIHFGVTPGQTTGRGGMDDRQGLTSALGDFAASLAPLQVSAVVIVDEAQTMAADVLKRLAELADGDVSRRIQIVLVGQPTLSAALHETALRDVEERVTVRARLEPLAAEETADYVVHRLAVAGTTARVQFDDAALAELHSTTGGVPRLINLVCDRALTRGAELSAGVIDDSLIGAAAVDLGIVPLRPDFRGVTRLAATAIVLVTLTACGGAAALWVFRADVSRAIAAWEGRPPPRAVTFEMFAPQFEPAPPAEEPPAAEADQEEPADQADFTPGR